MPLTCSYKVFCALQHYIVTYGRMRGIAHSCPMKNVYLPDFCQNKVYIEWFLWNPSLDVDQ
ncbi:hypothetical protein GHA01_11080 [Novacetimonas hansenii]|uniref:Uncharacterized protein n=1 Tax=Novacetimonas hansenii TaxID=436 RepID=A0ABQ0SDH3_NOVHA|nr:hypothetical protein Gaha_0188_036 [Novacetimonas hansenii JCM 7643]GBQ52760.1 hypothetical protein AA0243_0133 [Novacetimonas hansenii NRIC 0243]GEC63259.1 hypothetical protein GHA01_11080 [Novacetimonas hansenii]